MSPTGCLDCPQAKLGLVIVAAALLAISALAAAQPSERRVAAVHLYDNSRAYRDHFGLEDAANGFPGLLKELANGLEPSQQHHVLVRVGPDRYRTDVACELVVGREQFGKPDFMNNVVSCRNKVFHASPNERAEMVGAITTAISTLRKAPRSSKLLMIYSTFYDGLQPQVLGGVDLGGICVGVVYSLRHLVSAQAREARKAELVRMQSWEQVMRQSGAAGVYFLHTHSEWYREIAKKGLVDCLAGRA